MCGNCSCGDERAIPKVSGYVEKIGDFMKTNLEFALEVRFKKLHPEAVIPTQDSENAGMDMTAVSVEETTDFVEYCTGIACEIPAGHMGLLFPRSSNSKKDLLLCNSVGIVDAGYRGEVRFRFKKVRNEEQLDLPFMGMAKAPIKIFKVGDAVGQMVILPYPRIRSIDAGDEELSTSVRGTGGFGASGEQGRVYGVPQTETIS